MQSMDDALYAFAQAGRISGEDAWLKAINKKRFEEFAPPG
jgi:Tfp pilus assembly ATPase PilU